MAVESTAPQTQTPQIPEQTYSELTVRALVSGLLVGSLIGASNVCIGLKIGWTFGASITAAVISFALFKAMSGMLSRPYGAKENLITATAGSAAGTMASAGGFVACIPALELYLRETQGPGHDLTYLQLVIWAIAIAFLGVFFAVPLRKQMVVREKLRYPSGTAAAETIRAMYSSGEEAVKKAKILFYGALAAAVIKILVSIKPLGLGHFSDFSLDDIGLTSVAILGIPLASLRMGISLSPMMLGAGILVGNKVGWSLFLGSILAWGVGAPILVDTGIVVPKDPNNVYLAAFRWLLWPGVALMVAAGFASLAMQYKTIGNTFGSFKKLIQGRKVEAQAGDEDDAPDPFPIKWWAVGMVFATTLTTVLAQVYFNIPAWMGILAVILSFLIASIAVRATGETDINPVGAMGKITQVVYGALDPGQIPTNLMAAGITAAGASQSGDLMHDLKAGYMLKVSIRKQVIAQLVGVIVGVFTAAAVYRLLTAAYQIPGDDFTGPAVMAWHAMAQLLADGIKSLPAHAMTAATIGAIIGFAMPFVAKIKGVGKWLPSPIALGIAFMVTPYSALSMWLGAVITSYYTKKDPDMVDRYGASMASGLIAGEGLMMVVVAIMLIFGVSWIS
ncbi:OPT/YSL family transporter [bacterium]|jgi:OPT family oligopeptide transporter|nr:OPT/YSL family transporter [bacterium]